MNEDIEQDLESTEEMAIMNHTPTLYTIVPDFKGHPALKSDNNIFAFFAPGGFENDAQMIATAAFIVRACNAHDELVKTLKRVEANLTVDTATRLGIYKALKIAQGD